MPSGDPNRLALRLPSGFAVVLLIALGATQTSFPYPNQSTSSTASGRRVFRLVYYKVRSIPLAMDAPTHTNTYSVTSEDRQEVQLTEDNHSFRPALSRDGARIAYVHIKGPGCEGCLYPPEYEINLMNADGSQPHAIADIDRPISISWSPDGKTLAYFGFPMLADLVPGFPPELSAQIAMGMQRAVDPRLYLLPLDGPSPPRLLTDRALGDFKWSPDGKWIAYLCHAKQDLSQSAIQLCLSATTPNGESKVLSEGVPRGRYSWSPDGAHLAYFTSSKSNFALYVAGADGATPRLLTETKGFPGEPEWSRDGRRIVFSGKESKKAAIFLINVDGSGKTRLTAPKLQASRPFWSPDGKQIAFAGGAHGEPQVYIENDDGSGVRELTHDKKIGCRTDAWIEESSLLLLQCGPRSNLSYMGVTNLNFYTLATDDPNSRPMQLTTGGAAGISIAAVGESNEPSSKGSH